MKLLKNNAFTILEQNNLSFKLMKLEMHEVLNLKVAPGEIYSYQNNLFKVVLTRGDELGREKIAELIQNNIWPLFISYEIYDLFKKEQQEDLRNITRSLSIGDPVNNSKKQSNLLCQNMFFLYQNPTQDDVLNLQFQSSKNLCNFLLEDMSINKTLFQDIIKSNRYHFLIKQPFLASLLLLGFLKSSNHFSTKEMESLFLTSYFKDIGMCLIPYEKHEVSELSEEDRKFLHEHPEYSAQILSGRIPINSNYMDIMLNHHQFHSLIESNQTNQVSNQENLKHIVGAETLFISIFDILAALITERPYRKALTLYEALEKIRTIMLKNYSNDFKHIVLFAKKYFT